MAYFVLMWHVRVKSRCWHGRLPVMLMLKFTWHVALTMHVMVSVNDDVVGNLVVCAVVPGHGWMLAEWWHVMWPCLIGQHDPWTTGLFSCCRPVIPYPLGHNTAQDPLNLLRALDWCSPNPLRPNADCPPERTVKRCSSILWLSSSYFINAFWEWLMT